MTPRLFGEYPLPSPLPDRGTCGPQVWVVTADGYQGEDAALLDPDERRRVAAFRRVADRQCYTAAHTALRRLLGAYLSADPAAITFVRQACPCCGDPHGRPAVAGAALHFSLSHTAGLAVLAFARMPVGVDVEALPSYEAVSHVSRALHPTEQAELNMLPVPARPAAFARCWTRKEAYLKGVGTGLAGDLLAGTYVGTGPRPAEVGGWSLTDVRIQSGHAAACALRNQVPESFHDHGSREPHESHDESHDDSHDPHHHLRLHRRPL